MTNTSTPRASFVKHKPGDCSGWSQQSSKTGAAGGIQNALKTIEQELEAGETLVELC